MEKITTKNIFLLAIGFLALSMIGWHWPLLSSSFCALLFLFTLYTSSKSIINGLLMAIFEISLGSLGKLFTISELLPVSLSIRLAIFCGVILGTIFYLVKNITAKKILFGNLKNIKFYLLIFPIIIFSIIVGLFKNKFGLVYSDANAWIFYGYLLPALTIEYNQIFTNKVLKIIIGTGLATTSLTILIYVLYGWGLIGVPVFSWLYTWLRQVGWGEVTHVTGNLYRVFSQSHIMILAMWAICLNIITFKKFEVLNKNSAQLLLFLTSLLLIINMSRSMWIGAICLVLFFLITTGKKLISNWKLLLIVLIGAILTSGLLIGRLGFLSFATRATQQPSEPAIASRLVQLVPLYNGIKGHWLLGAGFGGQVGYPSQDPRAKLHLDANGLYWTSAFEWGYLDQLFKFGVFAFILFFFFISKILISLYKSNKAGESLILSVLIVIAATHIFSPFLNHPLGISWLIAGIIAINNTNYEIKNNN